MPSTETSPLYGYPIVIYDLRNLMRLVIDPFFAARFALRTSAGLLFESDMLLSANDVDVSSSAVD